MKALILYDSKYGNTRQVAEIVAKITGSPFLQVNEFNPALLNGVDLLVVDSPIHNWGPIQDTVHLLSQLGKTGLHGKYVAAFETGYQSALAGKAAPKILKGLTKVGGRQLVSPQKFIVEGVEGPLGPQELDRAHEWCQELIKRFQAAGPLKV